MKILYFYKFCVLGGVTTQLANRLEFLRRRSEVHFAFLEDYGGASAFKGYEHVRILGTTDEIRAYLDAHHFDVIITIDTYELYAALGPAVPGQVIIHEVHTTYPEPLARLAESKDLLPFHYVITPSDYMKKLLEEMGIPGAFHINNCLDMELFRYEAAVRIEPVTILWAGKLDGHKNWRAFVNIAGKLQAEHPELQFMLAGGYTALAEVKQQLLETVQELGLTNFQWLPKVEYEHMHIYYSAVADSGGVYVSTSANESFGMTVLEAMACKCPVAVPQVGALPELLDGELNRALYPPGDEAACVELVNRLLSGHSLRKHLSEAGERKARSMYSIDEVGRAYMELLEHFCAEQRSRKTGG